MAGAERVVVELVTQGAQKAVQDFAAVGQATQGLFVVQESIGVRQRVLYDSVAQAAQRAAQQQSDAARRAADDMREAQERTTQVVERGVSRRLTLIREEATAQSRTAGLAQRGGDLRLRTLIQPANQRLAIGANIVSNTEQTNRLTQAFRQAATTGQSFNAALAQIQQTSNQVTTASTSKTKAIRDQSTAETHAKSSGITYLSVLSAIHAASFLASNRTFTLAGSFVTLGLAFGKMGGVAAGVGLALGGLLAVFSALTNAMGLIQQAAIGTVTVLAKVGAVGAAALVGAGVAGTKLAADLESQFALIQGVTRAPIESLRELQQVVVDVASRFGVSASAVAEGASLFIRAGGGIRSAIEGATEAITQLVVASKGELLPAEAATAISAGLNQFNLDGTEAVRVANALAGAAQASALSFTSVTQAFIQAAPGARTLGISLEDTAAGIALLGNELVKGTITGTAFKQFLLDLINPSAKAKSILSEFGISVQTSTGAIRPFTDVLFDLNKALGDEAVAQGRVTAAQRANALAVVFGSRAALAANILTREGASGLATFRKELEGVTAVDIADTLLLPLNKQFEILRVNAELLGEIFGAPLLQPIKNTVVQAINLVRSLRESAELVGQAISVIISGKGFGELQKNISSIADPHVAVFLIELVNSFRNVRDVIVNSIIPAIQDFFKNMGLVNTEAGRLTDTVTGFQNINRAIQLVGAGVAAAIRRFSEFTTNLIHNEGRAADFRKALERMATAMIAQVVPGLISTVLFLGLAAKSMIKLGEITIEVVSNIGNLFQELAQVTFEVGNAFDTLGTSLKRTQLTFFSNQALIEGNLDQFKALQAEIAELDKPKMRSRPEVTEFFVKLSNSVGAARTNINNTISKFSEDANTQVRNTIKSFENLAGTIPDLLSNLRQDLAAEQERTRVVVSGAGTEGFVPGGLDAAALKRAGDRVAEAGRDVVKRLENIREDAAIRATEILDKALERIEDIFEKADEQIARLARDTRERIDDLNEGVRQRREDRGIIDDLRKSQEDQLRIRQRTIDAIELLERRSTETIEREFDQQQQAAERAYTRVQQDAERAFGNIQKERERALADSQSAEEKALRSVLDAEARARQEQRELQEAKPEDRQEILKKHAQAAEDRKFEEKQQQAVDALRKQHESAQRSTQRSAEEAQTAFRRSQEESLLVFRRKQEEQAITFRRGLEDAAHVIRLRREDELFNIRKGHEKALQDEQDRLEDNATDRQITRIQREAKERREEIERTRDVQIRELETGVMQQLVGQINDVGRQLRNTVQQFEDSLDGLEPDVKAGVLPAIELIRDQIRGLTEGITDDLQLRTDQITARLGAEREFGLAKAGASGRVQLTEQQVVGTLTVLNFVLPPAFGSAITEAIRAGLGDGGDSRIHINELNQTIETDDPQGFIDAIVASSRIGIRA